MQNKILYLLQDETIRKKIELVRISSSTYLLKNIGTPSSRRLWPVSKISMDQGLEVLISNG